MLSLGMACAGPSANRLQGGAGEQPNSGAVAAPIFRPEPAVPSGPPIASDDDAERRRRELDELSDHDPDRRGRRQTLLNYYVNSAKSALDRRQPDDAFASFELALTLFEPAELQDAAHAVVAASLLPIARQIDQVFSRRGAHPQVITALMVQLTLNPSDEDARRRYGLLRSWLESQTDGVSKLLRGRTGSLPELLATPPPTLMSDLEQTYRVWPAALVREDLVTIYRAEASSSFAGGKPRPKDFLQSLSASLRRKGLTNGPAFKVARLYLRASKPQEAVVAIKSLGRLSGEEARLLDQLEETLGRPPSSADDSERLLPAVKLAMSLAQNPEDAEVSLQICRDVAVRSPKLAPAQMCIGELAIALERKGLALRAFEQARQLAPGERSVWDMVGRLHVDRLGDLVVDERTDELEPALGVVESFYASMRKQFPDHPPTTGLAVALAEVGRGYYNAGRIDDAMRFLARSIAIEPNAVALEQLGVLELRRGENGQATATLERARAVFMANEQAEATLRMLFFARMGRLIVESLENQNQPEAQQLLRDTREKTLRQFEQLLDSNRLSSARAAEAEVERGKLLYQGGDREQALEAFQRAADFAHGDEQSKGQGQVFVDLLAFLVPRGELDEAVSMYHRALNQSRLPEGMRVYCSMWVEDLLKRAKLPPDPLAEATLVGVQGNKWPADLARWATGQLSDQELLQHANSRGRQAEANFYLSMARLRAGDRGQAESLWRKVIDSQMLGYFEFEMASQFLRRGGAPVAPTAPQRPVNRVRVPQSAPPPAGSI